MLHFAYGSNLLVERMRLPERAPSARPVSVARLEGWSLHFDKIGADGSGKATVRPGNDLGQEVHGVLYDLRDDERKRLDGVEGAGYTTRTVKVMTAGSPRKAWLYMAVESFIDPGRVPFRWYRALVHAGARQHKLPAAYTNAIEAVFAEEDPDLERAQRMYQVLETAGLPLLRG